MNNAILEIRIMNKYGFTKEQATEIVRYWRANPEVTIDKFAEIAIRISNFFKIPIV